MVQKATIWMLAAVMCISMMAPLTAAASAEDVERLNKIIEELPAEEDLTGEQARVTASWKRNMKRCCLAG